MGNDDEFMSTEGAEGCCRCLVCQVITKEFSDHVIARAMTVEASKLYARIYFRHELDA